MTQGPNLQITKAQSKLFSTDYELINFGPFVQFSKTKQKIKGFPNKINHKHVREKGFKQLEK